MLMTQAAFARRHGVSTRTVSEWKVRELLAFEDNLVDVEQSESLLANRVQHRRRDRGAQHQRKIEERAPEPEPTQSDFDMGVEAQAVLATTLAICKRLLALGEKHAPDIAFKPDHPRALNKLIDLEMAATLRELRPLSDDDIVRRFFEALRSAKALPSRP